MKQQQYDDQVQHCAAELSLSHVEEIILAALHMRNLKVGQTIDITQLQEDCMSIGYSTRELSQGLVCLLTRKYLTPCGEISFMLTGEGFRAGDVLSMGGDN